jgi:hypothetical protein
MKLKKPKLTPLDRVCKVLDDEKLIYMRAKLIIKDGETKEDIETVAVMVGAVFLKKTGEYMFAAPIANPLPRNHAPS